MKERGKTGRAIVAAALVSFSSGLGLLLMEGLVRLLFPAFDPSDRFALRYQVGILNLGEPGTQQRQIKNTGDYNVAISINRYGLRDTKDIAKANKNDLIVVGDSFAWGWGVEESDRFSNRLQDFDRRQVFNLATPTDIAGYAALLDYAKSLGARIGQVVIMVCMENDLRIYEPNPARHRREVDWVSSWKLWLMSKSALYFMLTTAVHKTPSLKVLAARFGVLTPNLEGISTNIYNTDVIESSAEKLQGLSDFYHPLVVLIPSRGLWVGPNRNAENRVHSALTASLIRRGIKLLDLRPWFEASGAPLTYHFSYDGHWNARGHALAAGAISQCLARRIDVCSY